MLAEIVKIQPMLPTSPLQRATNRNLHIFMRTIDSFEDYVEPIDEVINDIFLPVLFCQTEPLPDELREPFPIAPAQGALGIPYLKAETSQQYAASKLIRAPHKAARLAKINSAGQRQWRKLVAQRRSP